MESSFLMKSIKLPLLAKLARTPTGTSAERECNTLCSSLSKVSQASIEKSIHQSPKRLITRLGTVANVKSDRKGPNGQQHMVPVDTTDILFIGSGAFTGLEKIVGQRLDKKSLGFGAFRTIIHSEISS